MKHLCETSCNDIFIQDIWEIIHQYTEDNYTAYNLTLFEQYNRYSLKPTNYMDLRDIIIKDPFFLSITAPDFLRQFILSSQIAIPNEPTQIQVNMARCKAMKAYLDGILKRLYWFERYYETYKNGYYDIESRLQRRRDLKCYAICFSFYKVLLALFLYLMIKGGQCIQDNTIWSNNVKLGDVPQSCNYQLGFGIFLSVCMLLVILREVELCYKKKKPMLSCANRFEEISQSDFIQQEKQKVHSYLFFDALSKIKRKEHAIKICEYFEILLGVPSGAIRKCKLENVMAGIQLRCNSSHHPNLVDTLPPEVKIEALDNDDTDILQLIF